jgi:2-keto-4-pentenoate hydratase/2-oxohepta-3-ene-1,7-dioic acid hydratase in catechol pathway
LKTPAIVKESGRKPPPFPFIFFKPATTIHDHGEAVVIPQIAQNYQADYEGELVRYILSTSIAHIMELANLDDSAL